MTISNIFNKENISNENPFEGVIIKNEISMSDYKAIADNVNRLVFTEEGKLIPLTVEFAIKLSIMIGLSENVEYDDFNADEIFTAVICTDIYNKFESLFDDAGKNMINTITRGLYDMIDYNVKIANSQSKNLSNILNIFSEFLKQDEVANLITTIIDKEVENNGEA